MKMLPGVPRLTLVEAIDTEPVPDQQLMRRLAEGDRGALDVLHQRYGSFLMSLVTRQLGRAAAQDVVQEVFVSIWLRAHSFDSQRGSFRGWVVQITRRRMINELRRQRSRPQPEADPDGALLEKLSADVPDMTDQLIEAERRWAVTGALQALPESQREAIALAFLNELTHQEVATVLKLPLGTTKTRIRSGLSKLRMELTSFDLAA
jgi:RNA polymerase sigma-70 factor (ECF subfamily)